MLKFTKFLLFGLILIISSLSANALVKTNWTQYGGTSQNHHFAHNVNDFIGNPNLTWDGNNVDYVFGQPFEPMVTDFTGDSNLEFIIFDTNGFMYMLNMTDGNAIYSTLFEYKQIAQPTLSERDYVTILRRNNDSTQHFSVIRTSPSFAFNFTIPITSGSAVGSGIKCFAQSGINYCLFVDSDFIIHTINMDSQTETTFNITQASSFQKFPTPKGNPVIPAIRDLDGTNGVEASFMLDTNATQQIIVVYNVQNNNLATFFSGDGIISGLGNFLNMSPLFASTITTAGFPYLYFASSSTVANARLMIYDVTGSQVFDGSVGAAIADYSSVPTETLCLNIGDTQDMRTWYSLVGESSTASYGKLIAYTNFSSATQTSSTLAGATAPFSQNQEIVAYDLTNDGRSEVLLSWNTGSGLTISILSCRNANFSGILKNLSFEASADFQRYNFAVVDGNQDGVWDIIATRDGATKFFNSESSSVGNSSNFSGGTPVNNPPSITSVSPSTPSPIRKGTSYYYTFVATDPESDGIFGAVKCRIGTSDPASGFGTSPNTFNTAHFPCNIDNLTCFNSRVWATDNQGTRQFATFPYDDDFSGLFKDINVSTRYFCGDAQCDISENFATCPADCPIITCGDTTCQITESEVNCPIDCITGTCGNAICSISENFASCPADCPQTSCGDSACGCNPLETSSSCPYDCFQLGDCGDTFCSADESFITCPADCLQITCGNGICNSGENTTSCPADCTICGNGVCEGLESSVSSSSFCSLDCPSQDLEVPFLLVSVDDDDPTNPETATGLLPELYNGIRAFFAPSLVPLLTIFVFIMIFMVFLLIANIIKKKIGNG